MSFVADSPVHSSSSGEEFAAYLDSNLDSASDSGHEESEDQDASQPEPEPETKRMRMTFVETVESVEEPAGLTSRVLVEQNTEASSNTGACTHPGSFGDMCILCGQRLEEESGVMFGYIHKGLRLGSDEIVRLRNKDMKTLKSLKKLYLVLDLDHTLLNSTQLMHMTPEEEYLKSQADSLQDVSKGSLFMLEFMHMMTKLRPFVRPFLEEASQMFEMYIYTMGDRGYALEMAKLLDPRQEYFHGRVISRDDGTERHQKGLDVVLGQESAVLILDDTENAWTKHKDNLILMERYLFFASSCHQFGVNGKSLTQLKQDESDSDGALASVLTALKRIHQMFFNELADDNDVRDVRQVLRTVRKDVLKGCKIVFSRIFPTQSRPGDHHLWKLAEQLGAKCSPDVDPSVTHVVSTDLGTEKSRWALKHEKFVVHPRWIEAANYLWQKQPEANFPVSQTKN